MDVGRQGVAIVWTPFCVASDRTVPRAPTIIAHAESLLSQANASSPSPRCEHAAVPRALQSRPGTFKQSSLFRGFGSVGWLQRAIRATPSRRAYCTVFGARVLKTLSTHDGRREKGRGFPPLWRFWHGGAHPAEPESVDSVLPKSAVFCGTW